MNTNQTRMRLTESVNIRTKALLEILPKVATQENDHVGSFAFPLAQRVSQLVRTRSNGRDTQTVAPLTKGFPQLRLTKVADSAGRTPPEMREPRERPATSPPGSFVNSVGAKMMLIPSGSFQMGSPASDSDGEDNERPRHRVTISRSFYMGSTEVTQGQWKALMGTEPWKGKNYVQEGSNYPAIYVNWEDALDFCRRLSDREGRTYRLPTEAEWEYACRGGSETIFSFGDDASSLGQYGWYRNALDADERYAHAVGQKLANGYGLHDLHGNVWEWCSDWYGEDYYASSPSTDPLGPSKGSDRVIRGGSWYVIPRFCRSAGIENSRSAQLCRE